MQTSARKALAALALALTAGLAVAGPAQAEEWSQDSFHSELPGTHNWYETSFDSYIGVSDNDTSVTWSNVTTNAATGGDTTPASIELIDNWQADGIGLSCSAGYPAGASCSTNSFQTTVTRSSKASGTRQIVHTYDSVGIGGAALTYAAEWSQGLFTVGSNVYEADASQSVGL